MREAVVDLSDEELAELGFGALVPHVREAGVRDVRMLEDEGYTCTPQLEVEQGLDGALLDSLECVDRWELVAEKASSYLYVLELTAVGLPDDIATDYDDVIGTCSPEVSDRGLLLSFVGSREAIRDVLRHYEVAGISPDLLRLAAYEGSETTLDALTARQLEVLRTAYEMGFDEIHRETPPTRSLPSWSSTRRRSRNTSSGPSGTSWRDSSRPSRLARPTLPRQPSTPDPYKSPRHVRRYRYAPPRGFAPMAHTDEADGESSGDRLADAADLPAAQNRSLRWGAYLIVVSGRGFVANGLAIRYRALFDPDSRRAWTRSAGPRGRSSQRRTRRSSTTSTTSTSTWPG